MTDQYTRREFLERLAIAGTATLAARQSRVVLPRLAGRADAHLLYVASPGIRNYVEWGGVGVLVFDLADRCRLVRRIATPEVVQNGTPENVKGICASAATGRLYVSTIKRLLCIDLRTDAVLWTRAFDAGCDRMSITPDGKAIFLPSLEGPIWYVVDGTSGDELARIETNSGAHNTIVGPSGERAYLAGLKSPLLRVADTRSRAVVREVGPFSNVIRPFTIDGAERRCFVNLNDLLGFEVGDMTTGKVLHHVEVPGFSKGPVKRHGCPSHGIALTPDERELWLADGANSRVHIFDLGASPPRYVRSLAVRDQPGWITLTIDGRLAIPSTGEVVDTRTKEIVATLADEAGKPVQSEKLLEVVIGDRGPVRTGDQFAMGRASASNGRLR